MTIRMQWHLTLSIGKWIRVEWNGEVSASLLFTTGAGYRAQEGMAMLVEKYRNIRGQNTTVTSFAAWKLPLCMKRYESMREALCINVWIWNTLKYSLGSAGLQLAQCARNCLNNSLNSAIRISAGPGWACSLYTLYAIELWRFFAEFSQCIEKATTWAFLLLDALLWSLCWRPIFTSNNVYMPIVHSVFIIHSKSASRCFQQNKEEALIGAF